MQQHRKQLPFCGVLLLAFVLVLLSSGPSLWGSHSPLNSSTRQEEMSLRLSLRIAPIVLEAIHSGRPVVALESTVVTHGGLGYPRNIETARALENEIRSRGAIPATIAVMNGGIHVGLSEEELDQLAKETRAVKCSRRDLGAALALGWTGSTTVAATIFVAHAAGIAVFATGGLGGVHRGAFSGKSASLDVSADLTELGRTPVTVVCAGVKSILDVPGTLEWLETQGVPVAVLNSNSFPQFFSSANDEGTAIPAPLSVKNVQEAARIMKANRNLQIESGMVLAVPNDHPVKGIEAIVEQALAESTNVKGKDITPFVLKKVAELSNGKSIISNIELLKNNAKIAAELAVEYHKIL